MNDPRSTQHPAGVDYCTLHHGIRNEDDSVCDFARFDVDDPDVETEDDEPRPCELRECFYTVPAAVSPFDPYGAARYPVDPLAQAITRQASLSDIAVACGVSERTVSRWRKHGLTNLAADRAAVTLGTHPSLIWPEFR